MKISIVVPVYNVEKYLKECVDSLLAQTLPALEIILVDDGSKDTSGQICDEYAAQYPQIKAVHKENAGLGMARNTGLDHVTGDYVVFIDSDDFCQKDMVEQLAAIVERTGCDTCKTSFNRVDMESNFLHSETVVPGDFADEQVQKALLPRMIGSAPDRHDSIPMSACCTMYSMDIIREHGLRFVSERVWICEDLIFNIAYYTKAKRVILSDYIGYNYRTNPHSLSTTYRQDRFEKSLALYHEEKRLLSELGLYELCQYRLSRQFFVWLRLCFKQHESSSCPLTGKQIRKEIREICRNPQVQQIIRAYPVEQLGLKQKAFLYMIKHAMNNLLFIIYKTRLFS